MYLFVLALYGTEINCFASLDCNGDIMRLHVRKLGLDQTLVNRGGLYINERLVYKQGRASIYAQGNVFYINKEQHVHQQEKAFI